MFCLWCLIAATRDKRFRRAHPLPIPQLCCAARQNGLPCLYFHEHHKGPFHTSHYTPRFPIPETDHESDTLKGGSCFFSFPTFPPTFSYPIPYLNLHLVHLDLDLDTLVSVKLIHPIFGYNIHTIHSDTPSSLSLTSRSRLTLQLYNPYKPIHNTQ